MAAQFLAEYGGKAPDELARVIPFVVRSRHYHEFLRFVAKEAGPGGTASLNMDLLIWHCVVAAHRYISWASCGLNTYDLTHGLLAQLLLTDCKNIRGTDLKFPFPTFVLRPPADANSPLVMTFADLPPSPVREIWVHTYTAAPASVLDGPQGELFKIDGQRAWNAPDEYADELDALWRSGEAAGVPHCLSISLEICPIRGPNIWSRRWWLDDGEPAQKWIEESEILRKDGLGDDPWNDQDQRVLRAIRQLVVNFLLWAGTHESSPMNVGKKDGTAARTVGFTVPKVWVFGREVKLARHIRDVAKEYVDGRGSRKHFFRLLRRSFVSGHWKRQHYGPGNSLTKLIHVEWYWRGPEEGVAFAKRYKVDVEDRKEEICRKTNGME